MTSECDNLLADALAVQLAGQTLDDTLVARLGQTRASCPPQRRALLARTLSAGRPEAALPWLILLLADPENVVAAEAIGSLRELLPWSIVRPFAETVCREPSLGDALASALRQLSADDVSRMLTRLLELHGASAEIALSLHRLSPGLSGRFKCLVQEVLARHYPPQITVAVTYRCNATCPYCYASVQRNAEGATMTSARFAGIVQHASRLGFKRIGFTGGEPTLHPDFAEFIRLAGDQGMTAFFASNGMFPSGLVDSLDANVCGGVTAHVWFSPDFGGEREAAFIVNLCRMHDRGLRVMLRYNLMPDAAIPLDDLERVYRRSHACQINLAVTVPNEGRRNRHVGREAMIAESARLLEAARVLRKRGLRPAFAKPLPPCVPAKDDWRWLGTIPHSVGTCAIWQVGGTHNVLINPDGTVWPCIVLNRPLCRFEEVASRQQLAGLGTACLTGIPKAITERCATCAFWESRRCQGGCLAFSNYTAS